MPESGANCEAWSVAGVVSRFGAATSWCHVSRLAGGVADEGGEYGSGDVGVLVLVPSAFVG
jgi:hypothetical protein